MKTTVKKIVIKEQSKVASKAVVNKSLDKIKNVKFTSDKIEEINNYDIVLSF